MVSWRTNHNFQMVMDFARIFSLQPDIPKTLKISFYGFVLTS